MNKKKPPSIEEEPGMPSPRESEHQFEYDNDPYNDYASDGIDLDNASENVVSEFHYASEANAAI